jgi:hypothetical protein
MPVRHPERAGGDRCRGTTDGLRVVGAGRDPDAVPDP